MGNNQFACSEVLAGFLEMAADIFIREAVKSIAAHAFFVK